MPRLLPAFVLAILLGLAGVQYAPRADRWVFDDDAGRARRSRPLSVAEGRYYYYPPRFHSTEEGHGGR